MILTRMDRVVISSDRDQGLKAGYRTVPQPGQLMHLPQGCLRPLANGRR